MQNPPVLMLGSKVPLFELGIEIVVLTYLTPVETIEVSRHCAVLDLHRDCGDLLLRNNKTVVQAVMPTTTVETIQKLVQLLSTTTTYFK